MPWTSKSSSSPGSLRRAGEALQRLVVQLAGPAAALALGRSDGFPGAVFGDRLRGGDRGGGAGGEGEQHALVFVAEAGVATERIERDEHAQGAAAKEEGCEQRGDAGVLIARTSHQAGVEVVNATRRPLLQHPPRDRAGDRDTRFGGLVFALTGDRGGEELIAGGEQNQQRASLDQGAAALDHDLEDTIEVGLAANRAGDLGRCFESVDGALHLVAAALHAGVEASVLDRDRRPLGEDHRRLLVGLVEVAAALLGQVEVAPGMAPNHHRHAEEVRHRRVAGGEAVGAGMVADFGQAEWARLLDQQAEHTAATWQVADRAPRLLVDAVGDEALQFVAVLIEHAKGGVTGPSQVAGDLEHLLEDHLRVELGDEAAPNVDQLPQTGLVQGAAVRPLCHLDVAPSLQPTNPWVTPSYLDSGAIFKVR
jgi:hypothetical protein